MSSNDRVSHPGWAARPPRGDGMSGLYERPRRNYLDRSRADPPPLPAWLHELRARTDAAIAASKEEVRDADDG